MDGAEDTKPVTENGSYTWDAENNMWKPKVATGENVWFDGKSYVYKDSDGTMMLWDTEKYAWFPKIDTDFLAMYNLTYGGNPVHATKAESEADPSLPQASASSTTAEGTPAVPLAGKQKNKRKDPEWFELDETKNSKVYVSNLPEDLTQDEFVEFMSKCGLIAKADGKNYSIKMYTDANGMFKGDALCTYIKVESVPLALEILDGAYLKNKQVKVERAKFQLKGEFDPSKKPRMKKKQDKEKLKKKQEQLLSWKLDPLRNVKEEKKSDRIVIVKNVFKPEDFEGEKISEILEFSADFREEAGKCGTVKKVVVHDRHPEGVVQINMSNAEEALQVVTLFNGRFFAGRQITAALWDGITKYHVQETEEEKAIREAQWVGSLQEQS